MRKINLSNSKLEELCSEIRKDIFKIIKKAGSGHLGACLSSTEMFAELYFGGLLNYNPENPSDENRDLVLVRGHIGPLRYKIFSMLGWVKESELDTYRQLGSRLQGHEDKDLVPGVDITPSGSLGMLLSYGVGAAIANKNLRKKSKVIVFLGDGEEQEGNVSEAARHATTQSLDNIICILDRNKKQLSHPTRDVDGGNVEKIWEGYGWKVMNIKDGHNHDEIKKVMTHAYNSNIPVFIIANTIKGKGIPGCEENYCGFHTISRCPPENLDLAIEAIGTNRKTRFFPYRKFKKPVLEGIEMDVSISPPKGVKSLERATDIYLRAIEKKIIGEGRNFYFMTADLDDTEYIKNYDFSKLTKFIDVGIREQHLFASAYGISLTDPKSRVWIHSGDAFLYRGSDQLNVIAQGGGRMIILGERAGLGQNRNGSSHESSGQPGALLTMPFMTFLEPADSTDLFNCYNYAFGKYPGPIYIRHHPLEIDEFSSEEPRNIDNYIVLSGNGKPDINIVGSGLAMANVVSAAKNLEKQGIKTRVINVVNPKTLERNLVSRLEKNAPIFTVYNGNARVLEYAVSAACMASAGFVSQGIYSHGFDLGTSGSIKDLVRFFGYDCEGIGSKVKEILG